MSKTSKNISVFEHESIRFDKGEKRITKEEFNALERHYGNGLPFYSLRYNGVQFNEYVGVIQVGKTVIEVLPKIDKNEENTEKWQKILIGMLKVVNGFDIKATSNSSLKIKSNSILDLYFEMFIGEVEYLLNLGLIKKYRKKEGNTLALKGSLLFAKQIQQNLTHQERFYVRHATYDVFHKLHIILYKTLCLLKQINTHSVLHGRICALLLRFPEMPDIKISEKTFNQLIFNRKNKDYRKAIEIAKLLLLKFHPDVSKGRTNVIALMFDMNLLWEQFIYVSLKKCKDVDMTITAQTNKYFWKPESGNRSRIRPDIVLNMNREDCVVLDTKWKNLNECNPSPDDLRQLYVYHEYYEASKVALIYPGNKSYKSKGVFLDSKTGYPLTKECSVISISIEKQIQQWQQNIYKEIQDWIKSH